MRDYALGVTFDLKFTTRAFASGIPTVLAGSPAVIAYPDNSTTPITAGITLTTSFDSADLGSAGLNNVRVVATTGNGYATGVNYALVISAGTVGGVSVVGEVIGEFSIEAQSPLRPTVPARTLDVTATGAAGIDWANVENPTTALDLSATQILSADAVGVVVGDVGGNVNGNVLGSVVGDLGGNVLGSVAGDLGGDVLGNVAGDVQGNVDGSVEALGVTAQGQVNAQVVDVLTVDVFAEPTGIPPATDTLSNKIGRLHQVLRNRISVDNNTGKIQYFNDANTAIWEKDYTDVGAIYDESEGNAP